MKIGITSSANQLSGGIYQYFHTLLNALNEYCNTHEDKLCLFNSEGTLSENSNPLITSSNIYPIQPPSHKKYVLNIAKKLLGQDNYFKLRTKFFSEFIKKSIPDKVPTRHDIKNWLHSLGIDFMIYPTPTILSFEINHPYVMSIHDLQHRLQPQFPEVSADGEFENREYLFKNAVKNAVLIIADSEIGKEDILTFYGDYISGDRIKILPYCPPPYLSNKLSFEKVKDIKSKYHLPDNYLFYPAQFWPHKNHHRIIEALHLLKNDFHIEIPIVFCGTYEGKIRTDQFNRVMTLINKFNLSNQVQYLGYISNEEMSALYILAYGLLMPTFFGPTNIPIIEAWAYNCPVITSDIRGIREQVEDAALLIDPLSSESIADSIKKLYTETNYRNTLKTKGERKFLSYNYIHYKDRLFDIINETKNLITKI